MLVLITKMTLIKDLRSCNNSMNSKDLRPNTSALASKKKKKSNALFSMLKPYKP